MTDIVKYCLGADIGGSHISAALVNMDKKAVVAESYRERKTDAQAPASDILEAWSELMQQVLFARPITAVSGIGIAVPGPFDYKKGISKILNVGKFDHLFGVNVRQYLSTNLNVALSEISFINDASAFALGEYSTISDKYSRILAITLGTGFGSTFIHDGVPQSEMLYHFPYKESIADDYFSTRWFVKTYNARSRNQITNVKDLTELAESGDAVAIELFEGFGNDLGKFLHQFVVNNKVECCIIGGNISKAWAYFAPHLLQKTECPVIKAKGNNYSSITGAALSTKLNPNEFRY